MINKFDFLISGQPCVNGGTCFVLNLGRKKRQTTTIAMGYYCQCPSLYTGTRCESYVTLCASNPCQNSGTCYQDATLNVIRCVCTPTYTGNFCNITTNGTNICTVNPTICYNGGTCRVNTSSSQGFSCACSPTTTGLYCEQPIGDCQTNPSPCANNGTCVRLEMDLFCNCFFSKFRFHL